MPLGLAKDSMLNLAELASKMDGTTGDYDSDEENVTLIEVEHGSERSDDIHGVESTDSKDSSSVEEVGNDHHGDDPRTDVGITARSGESSQQEEPKTSLTPSSSNGDNNAGTTSSGLASSSLPSSKADNDKRSPGSDGGSVDSSAQNGRATGQYAGFVADYHDFDSYSFHDSYSYSNYANNNPKASFVPTHFDSYSLREEPWWCCLLPWAGGNRLIESDDIMVIKDDGDSVSVGLKSMKQLEAGSSGTGVVRNSGKEDDEISTGSDVFGEKLSDKDRQAVLARLRLAQPDVASGTASTDDKHLEDGAAEGDPASSNEKAVSGTNDKGLLKNVLYSPTGAVRKTPKSIMRRSSTLLVPGQKGRGSLSNRGDRDSQRRSLFPNYEMQPEIKKDLHVAFSPMARVVTIKSLKDMEPEEKADIWWQKADYEEFRRTGRMIAKAMLEGGSEIWLATNESWQLPNQGKAATFHRASSLAERQAAFRKGDVNAKIEYEDTRDKWWHKFGHSRRGLEHIASIDEGRQRQANVKASIKAVLDEQRRQKAFHREDRDKLRMVYMQSTAWAKDLSLASGASDADAVAKDFDDESRKSREFYLLKFSRTNAPTNAPKSNKADMPAFMKPMMTMPIPANRFDANTTSQIRYRQKQQTTTATATSTSAVNKKLSAPGGAPARLTSEETTRVPLKDDRDDSSKQNMAKKAAGYASGDTVANMAAVLSGMGPIPKNVATAVGGP